jgi:hypothetical protein
MGRIARLTFTLALTALLTSCGDDPKPPSKPRAQWLSGLDLHENRAFAMAFAANGQLLVSGTAHNKRPAVAAWDGTRWEQIDVPEQVWLERLPSGDVVGIGLSKLYRFELHPLKVQELGVITPNPRTPFNQASARAAGDGAIFFVLDTGQFQRIAAGGTTATAIPVPPGTPDTALPGAYARTGDGRMFAGVRGAGIYEVFADHAEMVVPCSDPEIDDCNGGDILVLDSYAKEPLFRKGAAAGKVYRVDLAARRLRVVADMGKLTDRVLTSVADAPNGDLFLMMQGSDTTTAPGQLVRVPAGGDATALEGVTDDVIPGPAALAVRNDGRVFVNSGFLIQEVR